MDSKQLNYSIPDYMIKIENLNFPKINYKKTITAIRHREVIRKAINIIEQKIQDMPSLSELASLLGISRTYFSQIFKEVTGMRLQEYINQIRLEKAKDLLVNINLKIKEVSYQIGFKDPNYFCRKFKKVTGLTPTVWRLENFLNSKNHN